MNSSSSSGSRSIIVIHCRAPPAARSAHRRARAHRLGDLARVLVDLALHQHQEQILLAVEVRVQRARWRTRPRRRSPRPRRRGSRCARTRCARPRAGARACSPCSARASCARRRHRRHPMLLDRALAISIAFVIRASTAVRTGRYALVHDAGAPGNQQRREQPMAIATRPHLHRATRVEPGEPAHRRDLLRGPVRALGARQLERHRARLHRGRPPVARGLHRVRAPGGAVELLPVLLGRGRRRGQPVPLHRRRPAARSRSTSSPPSRSTRPATRSSSSASCRRCAASATARCPAACRRSSPS